MSVKIKAKVDKRAFTKQLKADLKEVALDMSKPLMEAVDRVMYTETTSFNWPRDPKNRDIIDSGKLRASARIYLKQNPITPVWRFVYDVPYANVIYYGGYIQAYGKGPMIYIPARPWVEIGASPVSKYNFPAFPWQQLFEENMAKYPTFSK